MGIGAKDQTNYLVAGSSRNVSQDSGGGIGGCSREDVDVVNKLRMCWVCHGVVHGLWGPHQWADCGKHDLQEAKKLEAELSNQRQNRQESRWPSDDSRTVAMEVGIR